MSPQVISELLTTEFYGLRYLSWRAAYGTLRLSFRMLSVVAL